MDKALLVGINAYPDAPLSGCVNDVVDMADYLVKEHGFAPSSIRLLTDKRATTKAILDRLTWLVTGAKPGDRLVFHYSGHGTQVADRNDHDEIDGLDEVICPVDFNWDEKFLIRDDTFNALFKTIPAGVKFVWVSDCCHSGSLTRDFFAPKSKPVRGKRGKAKILHNRYLAPPVDHAWRHHVATTKKVAARAITPSTLNLAFVSGCKDTQTSADAEFGGRPNGALTYFLLKTLRKNKAQPISKIVDLMRADLKKSGYDQVPQLDGLLTSKTFLG